MSDSVFNVSHAVLQLLVRQIMKESYLSKVQVTQNARGVCRIIGIPPNTLGVASISCSAPLPFIIENGETYFEINLLDSYDNFIFIDALGYNSTKSHRFYTVDEAIRELKSLVTTFRANTYYF